MSRTIRRKPLNLPRAPQMKKSGQGAHKLKKDRVKHKKREDYLYYGIEGWNP